MSAGKKNLMLLTILALVVLALYGLRYVLMEQRWEADINWNRLMKSDSMLAAERLLSKHGHTFSKHESIHELLEKKLPNGTIFLSSSNGLLLPQQARMLKEWVERGNTLILLPQFSSEARRKPSEKKASENEASESADATPPASDTATDTATPVDRNNGGAVQNEESPRDKKPQLDQRETESGQDDSNESNEPNEPNEPKQAPASEKHASPAPNLADKIAPDILFDHLGVERHFLPSSACKTKTGPLCPERSLQLPQLAYPLYLHDGLEVLKGSSKIGNLLLQDEQGQALQVYRYGSGHMVMVANNLFTNASLPYYDHAQILLYLAQINQANKHFMQVINLDYKPWPIALWEVAAYLLLSLALCLGLLFWRATRRFGPTLPEPEQTRRALIEHVDASARWFWKLPGGPDILIGAARADVLRLLQRRIPDWNKLSQQQQAERLATQCKLPQAKVWLALFERPVKFVHIFTEQVQILQTLRKHYERK